MTARLTDAERAQILAAYRAGGKGIAIAELHGVDKSYPSQLARRNGEPIRGHVRQWAKKRRLVPAMAAKRVVPVKRGRG